MYRSKLIAPVVSEKSYNQGSSLRTYTFIVDKDMNKQEIAQEVKKAYGVEIYSVNVLNRIGKTVRSYRNKRFTNGQKSDTKIAYVRLSEGFNLPVFASIDKERAEADKIQKAADKQAEKKTAKKSKEADKETK
jgi:ribosomal protein L23